MSEINVKVRSGVQTLYDTKVRVELVDTVRVLKQKICEKGDGLLETLIEVVYCGSVMENGNTIGSYDVIDGATIHAFKRNGRDAKPPLEPLPETELSKLSMAMRQLTGNLMARASLKNVSKTKVIENLMLTVPGVSKDPITITLLNRSEVLGKCVDRESLKRIAANYPALAAVAYHLAATVHDVLNMLNEARLGLEHNARTAQNIVSDEDLDDIDDTSPAPEASGQPVTTRPFSSSTITSEQLASAISNVTRQQPLPGTSRARTGAITSIRDVGSLEEIQQYAISRWVEHMGNPSPLRRPTENEYEHLQIMSDMGLENETINLAALRTSDDLGSAIDLVLNGFGTPNFGNNTQN